MSCWVGPTTAAHLEKLGIFTIDDFKAALADDPRLRVDVQTTRDYYSRQSERLTRVIRAIGYGVSVIMALGAVFGALLLCGSVTCDNSPRARPHSWNRG